MDAYLRDIAVTVRERADGRFGWVLLEGTGEPGMFSSYMRLQQSEDAYSSYSTAFAAGVAALRTLGDAMHGPRRSVG